MSNTTPRFVHAMYKSQYELFHVSLVVYIIVVYKPSLLIALAYTCMFIIRDVLEFTSNSITLCLKRGYQSGHNATWSYNLREPGAIYINIRYPRGLGLLYNNKFKGPVFFLRKVIQHTIRIDISGWKNSA